MNEVIWKWPLGSKLECIVCMEIFGAETMSVPPSCVRIHFLSTNDLPLKFMKKKAVDAIATFFDKELREGKSEVFVTCHMECCFDVKAEPEPTVMAPVFRLVTRRDPSA